MTHVSPALIGLASLACLGCVEGGGDLAISAGAPVTGAVRGTVFRCGIPVPDAEVALHVVQAEAGQARPVDTRVGPVTTDRAGGYVVEVGPAFAVPGPATVSLLVTGPGAMTQELPGATLELRLGTPPVDTLRLDADLGRATGACR